MLKVAQRINSVDVIEALADAMCLHDIPEHLRCDNGPEMISSAPWENRYYEGFNSKLKDEHLN